MEIDDVWTTLDVVDVFLNGLSSSLIVDVAALLMLLVQDLLFYWLNAMVLVSTLHLGDA